MLPDEFFSLCTSLPTVELRAIGALSHVKHYAEGDLVYSSGDSSDDFFIINRGVVEIIPGPGVPGDSTILGRGNIFGEIGAFTRTPRDQSARALAVLSVQCFAVKNFPELIRRVPSFVPFLCENLARRLIQARTIKGGCELVGSLANFDLITIYQTIVRSMRTGTLFINDERGEIISEFYFDKGAPRWGRFQHLLGEEAFWQVFLQPREAWTFMFSRELPSNMDFKEHKTITRGAEEMLMQAVQMRDEFESLRGSMSKKTGLLKRQQRNFVWPDSEPQTLRPTAEEIWQTAYNEPMSLADLYGQCNACALRIHQAVAGMLRAGLFALIAVEKDYGSPNAEPGQLLTDKDAPRPRDPSVGVAQNLQHTANTPNGSHEATPISAVAD